MLQSIHDNAKGWVAYLIVILISVPFALWGIQEYLGGDGKNVVAVVNGEEIDQQMVQSEVARQRQRIAQMFGQVPPGFEGSAMKKSALDSIINQTLLRQHAKDQGYRASAEEVYELIKTIPQFHKDGKFDADVYRQVMATQGQNAAGFEQQLRISLTDDQFRNAIAETAFLPKSEMERYQSLTNQKRDLELYTLKIQDVMANISISEEQIAQHYKDYPERFQTDEQIKLAYVELNEADISKSIQLSDDELEAFYSENADRYATPAKFKASHVKVAITDQQNEEQAQAKANALYEAISSGSKSIEDIAAATDDESIFAELGEVVGYINKGIVDEAFEDAVFSANEGDLLKPVKTPAGFEIIRVLEIVDGQQKSFEDAKTEVEKELRKEKTAARFEDLFEILRTTAFENDGSLEPSASAIGGEIKTTDFFSRKGGQGITANPKVVQAAFNPEVMSQGRNSSLLELSGSQAVVVRLDAHKKPELKPLADVHTQIADALKKEQSSKQLKEKGDALLASVQQAGNWESLGDQVSAVEKHADITRVDNKIPAYIVSKAFKIAKPAEGKASYESVNSPDGDYTIVAVTSVKPGETTVDDAAIAQYASYIGNRQQMATLKALRDMADIEMHLERLESE